MYFFELLLYGMEIKFWTAIFAGFTNSIKRWGENFLLLTPPAPLPHPYGRETKNFN